MTSPRFEDKLREALQVEAPAEAKKSVREMVTAGAQEILREREAASSEAGFRRRYASWRILKPVGLAAASFVLLFTGTALAATNAGPDSYLYPLRQRMEEARAALAIQNLDKANAEAGHANARLDEISEMAGKGKAEYVPDLLRRYETHINTAQTMADQAGAHGEDTSAINELIATTRSRHHDLLKSLEEMELLPEEFREGAKSEPKEDNDVGPESHDGNGSNEQPAGGYAGSQNSGSSGGSRAGSDDSAGSEASAGSDDSRDDEAESPDRSNDSRNDAAESPERSNESPEDAGGDQNNQEQQEGDAGEGDQGDGNGNDHDPPEHPSSPMPSEDDNHEPDNDSRSESRSESPGRSDLHNKNQEHPDRHRAKA